MHSDFILIPKLCRQRSAVIFGKEYLFLIPLLDIFRNLAVKSNLNSNNIVLNPLCLFVVQIAKYFLLADPSCAPIWKGLH